MTTKNPLHLPVYAKRPQRKIEQPFIDEQQVSGRYVRVTVEVPAPVVTDEDEDDLLDWAEGNVPGGEWDHHAPINDERTRWEFVVPLDPDYS